MSIETADIEKLATLFADKVKELTPSALDLASQMYVLSAFHSLISMVIFGGITYLFYYVSRYCYFRYTKDEYSSYDIAAIVAGVVGLFSGSITAVSLGMALSNFLSSYYPAAALLKELIK